MIQTLLFTYVATGYSGVQPVVLITFVLQNVLLHTVATPILSYDHSYVQLYYGYDYINCILPCAVSDRNTVAQNQLVCILFH